MVFMLNVGSILKTQYYSTSAYSCSKSFFCVDPETTDKKKKATKAKRHLDVLMVCFTFKSVYSCCWF